MLNPPLLAPPLSDNGVARWRQIADALAAEIAAATLAPGQRLPPEARLAARFGVNRHTVRRALEELSRGGLIRTEQGRGSFVTEDVMDYAIGQRPRFSEWVRRHNREPTGRVLALAELPADRAIASALGVRTGARIIRLDRLGLADGRPISLGSHHFPATRIPGLLAQLAAQASITAALAAAGVADYRRQVTRVTARMPEPREAELLHMARNRPLLISESVNVDEAGAVVEFGIARYPAARVQLVFEP